MSDDTPNTSPLAPFLIVIGIVAWLGAGGVYFQERQNDDFLNDPNYAPALFLLGVGCYVVLLAVILLSRRR